MAEQRIEGKGGSVTVISDSYGFGSISVGPPSRPEPPREDPAKDRVLLTKYLKETGWTADLLEFAIAAYRHPKAIGRTVPDRFTYQSETLYSRRQIAAWRETLREDPAKLGFALK